MHVLSPAFAATTEPHSPLRALAVGEDDSMIDIHDYSISVNGCCGSAAEEAQGSASITVGWLLGRAHLWAHYPHCVHSRAGALHSESAA